MQTNILSAAIDAIKRGQWPRWIGSLSPSELAQVLVNFKSWRDEPDGDFSLSPEEIEKRIVFIEVEIASRVAS